MKKHLLLIPFALLLMACPQKHKKPVSPGITISSPSKWRITEFETSGEKYKIKPNSYIEFRKEKKGTLYAGCNMGSLDFDLLDEFSIKINQIMSTRKYCKEIAKTETAIFTAIKEVDKYHCTTETLYLVNTKKYIVIKCEPF